MMSCPNFNSLVNDIVKIYLGSILPKKHAIWKSHYPNQTLKNQMWQILFNELKLRISTKDYAGYVTLRLKKKAHKD